MQQKRSNGVLNIKMRNKKAKIIRRKIYGERSTNRESRSYTKDDVGTVTADQWRQRYQKVKRSKDE